MAGATRMSLLTAIAAAAITATSVLPITTDKTSPTLVTNKITMAQMRTAILGGGTGYTATDPLNAGAATLATLTVSTAQNAVTDSIVSNTTVGTAATTRFKLLNDRSTATFQLQSSGFTTAGIGVADGVLLYNNGTGGINVVADNAVGVIKLYTGNQILAATINASQQTTFTAGVTVSAGGITVSAGGATISGLATLNEAIVLNANGTAGPGRIYKDASYGNAFYGQAGSTADTGFFNKNGVAFLYCVTNTANVQIPNGYLAVGGSFGCNGNTPQAKQVSGGTLAGVIAALVNTGILSS